MTTPPRNAYDYPQEYIEMMRDQFWRTFGASLDDEGDPQSPNYVNATKIGFADLTGGVIEYQITSTMFQPFIREAIEVISELTGIEFREVEQFDANSQTPFIQFVEVTGIEGKASTSPMNWAPNLNGWTSSTIKLDTNQVSVIDTDTVIHEMLHAFGLGHPGQYNGTNEWGDGIRFPEDTTYLSATSYQFIESEEYPSIGPAALEALWRNIGSAPEIINAGNDTYDFSNLEGTTCIVDTGGIDTIVLGDPEFLNSQGDYGYVVDLRPGTKSEIDFDFFTIMREVYADEEDGGGLLFSGSIVENLISGKGDDVLIGNIAENEIHAGAGNDKIYGEGASDTLFGEAGDDTIEGGDGNDWIYGGVDNDFLFGDDGADRFIAENGNDVIDGGGSEEDQCNYDQLSYSGVNQTTQFEMLDENDNVVSQGLGVFASAGEVTFTMGGEEFTDHYSNIEVFVGTGFNDVLKDLGVDEVWAGAGNDVIVGDDIPATEGVQILLIGEAGSDTILGGSGDDRIYGSAGNDELDGGAGNDSIYGGADNDRLRGGSGADLIDGGSGFDYVDYSQAERGVSVDLRNAFYGGAGGGAADGMGLEDSVDTLKSIEGVIGSAFDDVLRTNDVTASPFSTAKGGAGDDVLYAFGYHSQLEGGADDDVLYGSDVISSTTNMYGGDGNDQIYASTALNISGSIDGGAGNDIIHAQRGTFDIEGGDGNDFIWAGTYSYGSPTYVEGNEGADLFFVEDSAVITDFDPGQDFIVFNKSGLDGDSWLAGSEWHFVLVQSGADVLVNWGWDYYHDTIRIKNVVKSDFTDENHAVAYRSGAESIYATIVGTETANLTVIGDEATLSLEGGAGDDSIVAGAVGTTIQAGSGNDTILGSDLADNIAGERGDDTMAGGAGADKFVFRSAFGHDTITDLEVGDRIEITTDGVLTFGGLSEVDGSTIVQIGGMGGQSIFLDGVGIDHLAVDARDGLVAILMGDLAMGDETDNILIGGDDFDILRGLGGNDTLDGGAGDDLIDGGDGDDLIIASAGSDKIDGGAGIDTIDFSGSVGGFMVFDGSVSVSNGSLHTFTDIERIIGSESADNVESWAGLSGLTDEPTDPNYYGGIYFDGRGGDDYAVGGLGADTLLGGNGDDWLSGTDYADTFETVIGAGDTIDGEDGNDRLEGSGHADTLLGGAGDDVLLGNAGADTIDGGAGADTILAGLGDDVITGGEGADWFIFETGDGNDVVTDFGNGADKVDITIAAGTYLMNIDWNYVDLGNGDYQFDTVLHFSDAWDLTQEHQTITLQNVELDYNRIEMTQDPYTGDTIYSFGGSTSSTITGTAGGDYLEGTDGDDNIFGLEGDDMIAGGGGSDIIDAGAGNDVIAADAWDDETAGDDIITSGAGDDIFEFYGDFGNDVITDFELGDAIYLISQGWTYGGMDYAGADTVLTFVNQDPWEGTTISTLTFQNRLLDPNAIQAEGFGISVNDAYAL